MHLRTRRRERPVLAEMRALTGRVYRSVAGRFGAGAVARLERQGLPASVAEPLRAYFAGRLPSSAAIIEAQRAEIAGANEQFGFHYVPGSETERWLVRDAPSTKASGWLAASVSVQPRWGAFLHDCAEAFAAETILELGSCVGISGAYLASTSRKPQLVTLEGSPDLATIAERTISRVTDRYTLVRGRFADTLPVVLEGLSIDVAFVDGHHDGDATRAYVAAIVPHVRRGGLLILDDIRLHREMWEMWRDVSTGPGVQCAVNVGRYGLLIWDGETTNGRHFDLSRFTGWWPIGGSRADLLRLDRIGSR
jgi:predicted O-methyltransferase YrrM